MTDAYWLDTHRLFYKVAGEVTGTVAMIADVLSGTVTEVLPALELAELLSGQGGEIAGAFESRRADYEMPRGDMLIVTLEGSAFHVDLTGRTLAQVEPVETAPALYSPDGRRATFLKDEAVWVRDREGGAAEPLTEGGQLLFAFGRALESGITPVSGRKPAPPSGLWSPDGLWFATHRADERHLPVTGLVENAPPNGGRPQLHAFRTAGPDDEPPLVEFVIVEVATGRRLTASGHQVVPQVLSPFAMKQCWFAGAAFYFLDFDRFSARVSLVELNLINGAERVVVTETATEGWVDLHPNFGGQPMVRILPASGEFLWPSDRDGWAHLYLYDLQTGTVKAQVTQGDWVVREVVHVDAAARTILFLASGFGDDEDTAFRSLCTAQLDGSGFRRLVGGRGDFLVAPDPVSGEGQDKPFRPSYAPLGVSPDGAHAFGWVVGVNTPTRAVVVELATGRELVLGTADVEASWSAPRPRPFVALASDGVTPLHGALYFPSDFSDGQSYPVVDLIYPGPQQGAYIRRFPSGASMLLQSVAELGMIGVVLESRGAPGHSRAFHQAGRGRLTEPQIADHVAILEQLCARHAFMDQERIGIFGQSGGGYAAARALFDYPKVFKAAVAVCGNHDSRNYIAYWLNKYGGRPGTPERDGQANTTLAARLQGELFLVHGDMDENVHVGHTLALSAALIAADKPFEQLIVPGAGHGVLMESAYVVQRLWDFFVRTLLGTPPPSNFVLHYEREDMLAALRLMRPKFV